MNAEASGLISRFERSVSLLCWAYNEEALIASFLERATRLMEATVEDYEIVLIDDGSTDRTYEIAEEYQRRDSRIRIYRNHQNMNVGVSIPKAIQSATKEHLFWQTADWSYDIDNLRQYLEYSKTYDIVQGVRTKPVKAKIKFLSPLMTILKLFGIKHLTKRSDTVFKAIVSIINYALIRMLFSIPVSDFQNVTIYPTQWIQTIKYESRSAFTNPEGLIKSYWAGLSIKEVPISFIPRKEGAAKGTRPKAILNSVKDIMRLWLKWVFMNRRVFVKRGLVCGLSAPNEGAAADSIVHDRSRSVDNQIG